MPILTFKATEMKSAEVARISLVERAATRLPFKVIKQEKPMSVLKHLDLSSVFKREKPAVVPQIIGIGTMKSEHFESVKAQLEAAGFSVAKSADMEDGSVLFAQVEDMTGETALVRVSDEAVMAIKGFRPYMMDMTMEGGTSFAEVCKAQGFYPGVGTMVDVLRSSVLSLAEKSDDPSAAATQVGKMFDEAKQYAMTMVQGLPSKAFKLEGIWVEPVVAAKAEVPAEVVAPVVDAAAVVKAEPEAVVLAEPITEPVVQAAAVVEAPAVVATPAMTAEQVSGIVGDQLKDFASKMETIMGSMKDAVTGMGQSVTALTSRVEAAEGVAKSATEALEGTVVLGGDAGDHVQVVAKAEGQYRGREIDTAYIPRSARRRGQ